MDNFRDASLKLAGSLALLGGLALANPAQRHLGADPGWHRRRLHPDDLRHHQSRQYRLLRRSVWSCGQWRRQCACEHRLGHALRVCRRVQRATPGSALFTQSSNNYVGAFTASGGVVYGATFSSKYKSFNPDGTVANANVFHLLANKSYLGMWTNPADGHIISNSALGLIDINPATGNYTVITSSTGDGVSVSPDGKTAYSEQGSINGYDIATGTEVYSSGSQFPEPGRHRRDHRRLV